MDGITIIDYTPDLKHHIKELNVEWLSKYFFVEPNDEIQLSDPQKEIIEKGGLIYYARVNNQIVGTYSLLRITDEEYELGKMAVTESAKGKGIGEAMMQSALEKARNLKVKNLILYSNTSLIPAIKLYRKHGFEEVQLEPGHYVRANIKMEKKLI
ncbi:MAG: GNAT family N-acetyltransferase [Bacteroidota bacterium]|nr:GNAT family N-acetyltransferase [Bacteroidota bacterium]